jgi:hypothetical protein
MLLLPSVASAHPARNPSGVALSVKTSRPQSSLVQRFTIFFIIFGNRVTVVDMTAAQSEQIEQTMEGVECTSDLNIADKLVGCANSILSTTRMNTGGLLSELLRLTQVGFNLVVCLGTSDLIQAACISLTQETLRELIFGPPSIPSGTPPPSGTTPGPSQPSVPTTQSTTPTSSPSVLQASPMSFLVGNCPTQIINSAEYSVCVIVLSSPNSNQDTINWSATLAGTRTSASQGAVHVDPSSGTLSPGQQVNINLYVPMICGGPITNDETVTFTGGAAPIVVHWTC